MAEKTLDGLLDDFAMAWLGSGKRADDRRAEIRAEIMRRFAALETPPSDCGGCDALREAAAKLTEALDGGLEPELSGVRLLRSQLRGLLQTRTTNFSSVEREVALRVASAAALFCEEYRKEMRSAEAEVAKWPGWVDGFDSSSPLDAAYLKLREALETDVHARGPL